MAKILKFPSRKYSKYGYKRARRNKKTGLEQNGQLNLFFSSNLSSDKQDISIYHIPSRYHTFEDAIQLDEKNDPRAYNVYLRAIEENDSVPDSYCNLGIIESNKGNYLKAFDYFSKSLQIDERHFESHYNIANLYFEVDELKLSQLHYEIAIELEPDFPNSYFNLGLVFGIKKEFESAFQYLCKYKELVSLEDGKRADELIENLRIISSKNKKKKK